MSEIAVRKSQNINRHVCLRDRRGEKTRRLKDEQPRQRVQPTRTRNGIEIEWKLSGRSSQAAGLSPEKGSLHRFTHGFTDWVCDAPDVFFRVCLLSN